MEWIILLLLNVLVTCVVVYIFAIRKYNLIIRLSELIREIEADQRRGNESANKLNDEEKKILADAKCFIKQCCPKRNKKG